MMFFIQYFVFLGDSMVLDYVYAVVYSYIYSLFEHRPLVSWNVVANLGYLKSVMELWSRY